jgi:hypothetical protein
MQGIETGVEQGRRARQATSDPSAIAESDPVRLLVPIIRELHATALLEVGDALVAQSGGDGIVLGLVEVPRRRAPDLTPVVVERRRDLLRWIALIDAPGPADGTRLGIEIRVAHDVALGIREAAYENGSNLILAEWPGPTSRRPRLLGQVLDDLSSAPPADLLLVRPEHGSSRLRGSGRHVLVPARGGPNARMAVIAGAAMAELTGGSLSLLHVYHPQVRGRRKQAEREEFERLVEGARSLRPQVIERDSHDEARVILSEASAQSIFVLGAHADAQGSPLLVRSEIARTLRRLPGMVMLVRTAGSVSQRPPAERSADSPEVFGTAELRCGP